MKPVVNSSQILNAIMREHHIDDDANKHKPIAKLLHSTEEKIQAVFNGQTELSFAEAARVARALEIMPIVAIAAVGHHIALKEEKIDDAEMWKTLYYRNSTLGL